MFSSTFQGKFNFQGLIKTVMYIQVLPLPGPHYWITDMQYQMMHNKVLLDNEIGMTEIPCKKNGFGAVFASKGYPL